MADAVINTCKSPNLTSMPSFVIHSSTKSAPWLVMWLLNGKDWGLRWMTSCFFPFFSEETILEPNRMWRGQAVRNVPLEWERVTVTCAVSVENVFPWTVVLFLTLNCITLNCSNVYKRWQGAAPPPPTHTHSVKIVTWSGEAREQFARWEPPTPFCLCIVVYFLINLISCMHIHNHSLHISIKSSVNTYSNKSNCYAFKMWRSTSKWRETNSSVFYY